MNFYGNIIDDGWLRMMRGTYTAQHLDSHVINELRIPTNRPVESDDKGFEDCSMHMYMQYIHVCMHVKELSLVVSRSPCSKCERNPGLY